MASIDFRLYAQNIRAVDEALGKPERSEKEIIKEVSDAYSARVKAVNFVEAGGFESLDEAALAFGDKDHEARKAFFENLAKAIQPYTELLGTLEKSEATSAAMMRLQESVMWATAHFRQGGR